MDFAPQARSQRFTGMQQSMATTDLRIACPPQHGQIVTAGSTPILPNLARLQERREGSFHAWRGNEAR
jgi:hypothetical protein